MKSLSKVKLQNAVVLENQEMKMIFGGSGSGIESGVDARICGGSGYTHVCACTSGRGTWCDNYGSGAAYNAAIDRHCGTGNGSCRPFRN